MTEHPSIKLQNVHFSSFSDQQRKDRWPDPHNKYVSSTASRIVRNAEELDFLRLEDHEVYSGPPFISTWRMNLVALSQKHNLYFVACRDKLHVHRPRNLKQFLPSTPDIIVDLPVSQDGIEAGGYINPNLPHSVNNLMVGNLGSEEILLMCCDDGDVLAFYTFLLDYELQRPDRSQRVREIKPFLHTNVGLSAWGLAIHEKCRLMAVSSNLKEVTILAPSLTIDYQLLALDAREEASKENPLIFQVPEDEIFDISCPMYSDRDLYRKVTLALGDSAANIPAIDFANDENGNAAWVVAVDINGVAWRLNPEDNRRWKQRLAGTMPSEIWATPGDAHARSWGVLCLSPNDFRTVPTLQEAWNVDDDSLENVLRSHSLRNGQGRHCFNVTNPPLPPEPRIANQFQGSSEFQPPDAAGLSGGDDARSEFSVDLSEDGESTDSDSADEEVSPDEELMDEHRHLTDEDDSDNESYTSSSIDSFDLADSSSEAEPNVKSPRSVDDASQEMTVEAWENRVRPKLWNDSIFEPQETQKSGTEAMRKGRHKTKNTKEVKIPTDEEKILAMRESKANRDAEIELAFLLTHLPPEVIRTVRYWKDLRNLGCIYNRLETKGLMPLFQRKELPWHDKRALPLFQGKEFPWHDEWALPLVLLRTYAQDIELVELFPLESKNRPPIPTRVTPRLPMCPPREIARFNMLFRIPELHLVLVGSQSGSVVVLGLTKVFSPSKKKAMPPLLTCRVEGILPLPEHREMVPKCPLLGMAVGPLQGSREGGMGVRMWRRWRVLLHYYDHTVLSYEIYRGERGLLAFE